LDYDRSYARSSVIVEATDILKTLSPFNAKSNIDYIGLAGGWNI